MPHDVTVIRTGNSLAVIIPKGILAELKILRGDILRLRVNNRLQIVLTVKS